MDSGSNFHYFPFYLKNIWLHNNIVKSNVLQEINTFFLNQLCEKVLLLYDLKSDTELQAGALQLQVKHTQYTNP